MRTITFAEQLTFPESVRDHSSFREWVTSDDFPEKARVSYLDGDFWVDLPMERIAHNLCKQEFAGVLSNLIASEEMGHGFCDGMLLTNIDVGLSTQPEFMFVSSESLEAGRLKILQGDDTLEILGSPDMTLEVISPTSVEKDTVQLRRLYWEAEVKEYWLVDCRERSFSFDILRRGPAKYVASRKHNGWLKSHVFGREFKLTKKLGPHGITRYTLDMR